MRYFFVFWTSILLVYSACAQPSLPFLKNGNTTPTLQEIYTFYKALHRSYPNQTTWKSIGPTDVSDSLFVFELHLNSRQSVEPSNKIAAKTIRILVNNGIHPGEPEGINASMMFASDLLQQKIKLPTANEIVIAIIPVYNVGGCLQRSSTSRANQNGPEEYGFRGNAKNLDLNRDFMKQDAREAQSLTRYLVSFDPHVFIDTHTSNGADYPATLTFIETQFDKMNSARGQWMHNVLTPKIQQALQSTYPAIPYVNTLEETPDSGITCFVESPRFATGFTALWDVMGYTVETHMLKPFPERVAATYAFLLETTRAIANTIEQLPPARFWTPGTFYSFNYQVDFSRKNSLTFTGYEAEYPISDISGAPRLKYNRNKTWTRTIPFYERALPSDSDLIPQAVVIPHAWASVLEALFRVNPSLQMSSFTIKNDTTIQGGYYYITDYQTGKSPYEGHYVHSKIKTDFRHTKATFHTGDVIVQIHPNQARWLMEALHPRALDSYFAWGFFDAILQQKEYFSDYVFEDKALEILKDNPAFKHQFEAEKKLHPEWAKDPNAALHWIYIHSSYYEKTHKRYPIFFIH
jgi:hypothetical protein